MGAIFKCGDVQLGMSEIQPYFENLILDDFESRRTDEDMYRGDFGASTLAPEPRMKFDLKINSQKTITKRINEFHNYPFFEKYRIDWAIVGHLGYRAYKPDVYLKVKVRGTINVRTAKGTWLEFKNVTELKRALKNISTARTLLGARLYSGGVHIGYVVNRGRVYKSKPKKLPKKYMWIDKYVHVAYGGFNPY